ncbi:MAG: EF-P lysine aminoacylase EpmA [Gammaproteobacteria bacterium]
MSWEPSATIDILKVRAQVNAHIRSYFQIRNVIEVETPVANQYAVTDLHIDCIATDHDKFLHSSPEYAMKKLLAFHKCDIYQLCKVFRANEVGRLHHDEFTMLEWYRVEMNYKDLMKEVADLVTSLVCNYLELLETKFIRYQEIFKNYVCIDVETATQADYLQVFGDHSINLNSSLTIEQYQELVLDQIIVPKLEKQRMTFVYDYPAEQAALAKLNQSGVAERFELYLGGVELANGFQELTDAQQQLSRFEEDNRKRLLANKKAIEIDENFLSALESGLPESAGVALGVDRLLMVMLGVEHIDYVLSFS